MITKWKVFNFKSIRDETELEFAPLTIFAGSNSSGKSTLIQSMLMVTQTLSSKVSSRSVVLNGDLVRLGQFDDLRTYDSDIDQIAIGWECEPKGTESTASDTTANNRRVYMPSRLARIRNVKCELTFDADPSSPQRDMFQLQPRLFTFRSQSLSQTNAGLDRRSEISVSYAVGSQEESSSKLHGVHVIPREAYKARNALNYDVILDAESLNSIREDIASAEPIGCLFRHFLPESIYLRVDRIKEESFRVARFLCEDAFQLQRLKFSSDELNLMIPATALEAMRETGGIIMSKLIDKLMNPAPLFSSIDAHDISFSQWFDAMRSLSASDLSQYRRENYENQGLSDRLAKIIIQERLSADVANVDNRFELATSDIPRNLSGMLTYIDRFFANSVKYLGPLRDEPKPLYPLSWSNDPIDVGLRGEMTAAILDTHKERLISYIPTKAFLVPAIDTSKELKEQRTLETAVVDWLQYLGIVENVQTKDRGKLGHELQVKLEGTKQTSDLTHVGVGVSQVLPIVVMCLLAEPDTTLIFEQPELHLHPKVQTLLGDFFLSMALLGKQCIIETHSEYLINRLRFRTASSPISSPISSKIKTYFVEKKEGKSKFREVVINDYGAILEWPEGFFDQSQNESEEILRAAAKKRKSQRERT